MEEKILEIINNHFNVDLDERETLKVITKEIAEMVKAFIEWFLFKEHPGIFHWITPVGTTGYTIFHKTDITFDELFLYWHKEIWKQ